MNKLKVNAQVVLFLVVLILFSSCKNKSRYKFLLINKTNYRLDEVEFHSFREESVSITDVSPNSTTASFIVKYESGFSFSTPDGIYIDIDKFSDSTGTYENWDSENISIPDLSKREINKVEVSLNQDTTFAGKKFNIVTYH